jgi:mono/diheme cytochrome c family protein
MKRSAKKPSTRQLWAAKRQPGWSLVLTVAVGLSLAVSACGGEADEPWALREITQSYYFPARDFDGKIIDGGREITAATLNAGRTSFVHYCYACHGLNGDGKGPASHGLRPPPRDFRTGDFKFGSVRSGELPNDQDLMRIVSGGLHGTAMLQWDIPTDELWRIIQFIKTFPPPPCDPKASGEEKCAKEAEQWPEGKPNRWLKTYTKGKKKGQLKAKTGEPVAITKDPWAGDEEAAVRMGRDVYHLKAQCANCHPSYLTRADYNAMSIRVESKPKTSFRQNMYESIVLAAKDNPYQVPLMPPDFTLNPLRSIRDGRELSDLYRLIASGVGGVMPAWIDGLNQRELWSLAYYVKTLKELRKTEQRPEYNKLWDRLNGQSAMPAMPAMPVAPPTAAEEKPVEEKSDDEDAKDEDAKDEDAKDEDAKDEDAKDEDAKDEDAKPEAPAAPPPPPPAAKAPAPRPPAPQPKAPRPAPKAPKPPAPKPPAPKPKAPPSDSPYDI